MQIYCTSAIGFLGILFYSTIPSYGLQETNLESEAEVETEQDDSRQDGNRGDFSEEEIPEVRPEGILRSFENLTYWAEKEMKIYQLSKSRLQNLQNELNTLEEYIEDYASTTEQAVLHATIPLDTPKKRGEFIASSGIASYRMTYRYVHTLQRLKEQMAANYLDTELLELLWNKRPPQSKEELETEYKRRLAGEVLTDWPNRIDLAQALQSIIHIQEVYNFDYEDLPSMLAPDEEDPPGLNAFHCAQIGLHALYKEYYASAVEWIELAILKVGDGADLSIPLSTLETYLELASELHNEMLEFAKKSGEVSDENLFVKAVKPFQDFGDASRKKVSTVRTETYGGKKDPEFAAETYNGLCFGNIYLTAVEEVALKCWYDTNSSPIRSILPLKKELISAKPKIVQVYDFVGDKMISKILSLPKDCASPPENPEQVFFFDETRSKTAMTCTPQENSLPELEKKIEVLTRTDLSEKGSLEGFQFVESTYGKIIGPQGEPMDMDPNSPSEFGGMEDVDENDDTFISVHVFLNDVPYGGLTAFTSAGTSAVPVKGSALIWKTANKDGTARSDTKDSSCPILFGHKQVLTNVIRYSPQFRTFPCPVPKKFK